MKVQMSFADAYRIRAKRYVIACLTFVFLAFVSVVYQVQQKTVVFDILALIFTTLSLLSLVHTFTNYYKAARE